MSLRFPNFHARHALEEAAKATKQVFCRALTTNNHKASYSDDDLVYSSDEKLPPSAVDLELFAQLQQDGSAHNPYILNKIISSCAQTSSLFMGIQIHSAVIKTGFSSNVYICSALVDMYGKCSVISSAHKLFDEMPQRNAVTWNVLISGYLHSECPKTAVGLLLEMLKEGIAPTPFSASALLGSSAQLEAEELGAQVHGLCLKAGFYSNVAVGTGLIVMYSKCSKVGDSRRVFDEMADRNVITWTSMVTGYAHNEKPDEAMILFRETQRLGLRSNYVTYNSLLSSFCSAEDLDHCKQVHCRIIWEGFESNVYLAATLLTVYSECSGNLEDFHKICLGITRWDQVSWNAIIAGFSNLGNGEEALKCFSKMRQAGIHVDSFTFTSILKAIGSIPALQEGKHTHASVFKTGYASNTYVQNGLVAMYARCGAISDSKRVFWSMEKRDLISWNSLLSGCAYHGNGREAVEVFEQMRNSGVKPDNTSFLAVISACSHVGLLDKGLEYFNLMRNYALFEPPKVEHYACIVDLYGRAGCLHEAEAFINNMPIEPGPSVYKTLLSACRVHGNREIAVRSAKKLLNLYPDDPASYLLLSNVLAEGGSWDGVAWVRKIMHVSRVKKIPGFSWI
ncbi:pentatricopeptide repeat-containing protein At4g13650-like [Malania oleifera]|uniref:pentatricopeptide repeat-containing protein At4g13650-like n=1 Tax=Malania oleifera TaxID=397392 RepID=UPI0025ADD348|nr:pentatricopeptide repeat-containing protein At4g13650-like [Malania oleifera]